MDKGLSAILSKTINRAIDNSCLIVAVAEAATATTQPIRRNDQALSIGRP